MAVKGGMIPEAALAAITRWPAEIAGLDHRIGTLTPGKDADVVVTSEYPLNWLSRIQLVLIDGKKVTC
jgi:imidazolonepropionase-like amidohydrolase